MDFRHTQQLTHTINLSDIKFKQMDRLVNLITHNDGIIFGGYVRDKLIAEYHASEFKRKQCDSKRFNDLEYDTDTKLRLLVPNDLDVFITRNKFKKLMEAINDGGFYCTIDSVWGDDKYAERITHEKYSVSLVHPDILDVCPVTFGMDVLYTSKNIEPPFGKLDLECNGFILDKNGIRYSNCCSDQQLTPFEAKLRESQILNTMLQLRTKQVALSIDHSMENLNKKMRTKYFTRLFSMQLRGWKIQDFDCYTIKTNSHYTENQCLVCLEEFTLNEPYVHLNCCGAQIHTECFRTYIENQYNERLTPRCMNACTSRAEGLHILRFD